MSANPKQTTRLSTKGQLILPAEIRRRHQWSAGTRLEIEDTPDGIVIKAASPFEPSDPDEVFGCLAYDGPPRTVDEMNTAVEIEMRRRHARGRY